MFKPFRGTQLNRTHPLSRGLVGAWLFNECSGDILNDYSGNKNNGTLVNMNQSNWVGSPDGGALDFDGTDDYVQTLNIIDTSGSVSVAFLANVTDDFVIGGYGSNILNDVMSCRIVYDFGVPGWVVRWQYGDGSNGRISSLFANYRDIWTHIALISAGKGGNYKAIYINGILAASDTVSDGPDGEVVLQLGAFNSAQTLNGELNDVLIYNRQLSDADIKQLYFQPYAMFENPSPAKYFGDTGFVPYPRFGAMNGGIGNSMLGGIGA